MSEKEGGTVFLLRHPLWLACGEPRAVIIEQHELGHVQDILEKDKMILQMENEICKLTTENMALQVKLRETEGDLENAQHSYQNMAQNYDRACQELRVLLAVLTSNTVVPPCIPVLQTDEDGTITYCYLLVDQAYNAAGQIQDGQGHQDTAPQVPVSDVAIDLSLPEGHNMEAVDNIQAPDEPASTLYQEGFRVEAELVGREIVEQLSEFICFAQVEADKEPVVELPEQPVEQPVQQPVEPVVVDTIPVMFSEEVVRNAEVMMPPPPPPVPPVREMASVAPTPAVAKKVKWKKNLVERMILHTTFEQEQQQFKVVDTENQKGNHTSQPIRRDVYWSGGAMEVVAKEVTQVQPQVVWMPEQMKRQNLAENNSLHGSILKKVLDPPSKTSGHSKKENKDGGKIILRIKRERKKRPSKREEERKKKSERKRDWSSFFRKLDDRKWQEFGELVSDSELNDI